MSVPGQSAAIPVTPAEIVDSAVAAHAAGASILHVHVRDPATGRPVSDLGLFREVLDGIAARCDAIVQPTTGGGVGMTVDERARVVTSCRPELASFNTGSFNFGIFRARQRAGDGAVGGRVPRGHARLRLPQHVHDDGAARRAVPRGRDQARVRGLRRRPPLQPAPPGARPASSTSRARPVRPRRARRQRGDRRPADRTCAAPPSTCSAPATSRGRRPASATPASSTSRPRPCCCGGARARRPGGQPARRARPPAPGRTPSWSRRRPRWWACWTGGSPTRAEARALLGLPDPQRLGSGSSTGS